MQPDKYLHCVRLVEVGLSTRAQIYVRVLTDYVVQGCTQLFPDSDPYS